MLGSFRRMADVDTHGEPPSTGSVFRMDLVVPAEDIDALGHASNIAYVRWIQDVAVAHSESVSLVELS